MPFVEQREAVGHAVRANYLYAGAADLYLETGDAAAAGRRSSRFGRTSSTKKMYITGGCGALYDGASPDGSEDQSHITRVHQAYGRNYQLPNVTAHNETCAAIGNVLWNWRMFLATGEARYVDVLELALYNAVLSGVSLDGTTISTSIRCGKSSRCRRSCAGRGRACRSSLRTAARRTCCARSPR